MVAYHLNNPKYYVVLSLFSLATYGRLRYSSPCPNCAAAFDNDVTKFLHRSGARNGGHGALHPHAHAPVLPCCLDGIVSEYLLEAISYLPSCAPLYLLLPPALFLSSVPFPVCDHRYRPLVLIGYVFRLNCFSWNIIIAVTKYEPSVCNELFNFIRARYLISILHN